MKLAHLKTALLVLLVGLSFVLSYTLWQGNWQETSEVAFTDAPGITSAPSPQAGDVAVPYQIVFTATDPGLHAVGMPDSPLYTEWMKRLENIQIKGLRPAEAAWTKPAALTVEYDLGGTVAVNHIARWLPSPIAKVAPIHSIGRVTLYVARPSAKSPEQVEIRIDGTDSPYVAETDISAAKFKSDLSVLVKQYPWRTWNAANGPLVPAQDTTLPVVQMTTDTPSVLPLVHSFFVNPRALTRIQEGDRTVLWTDGSQVVWWNQRDQTLTYTDPNPSRVAANAEPDLSDATEFVRNHGGARQNTVLYRTDDFGNTSTYYLRTYLNGIPILGENQTYQIELRDGRVVQYQCPLTDLTTRVGESTVKVMGMNRLHQVLTAMLSKLGKGDVRDVTNVELGYYMADSRGATVSLVPAYFVYQAGDLFAVLNAQNGAVLKGMTGQ
jgi:regulatory protein YycH of two-component signal transduction system YycFG